MSWFPFYENIDNKTFLIIGGGQVAIEKTRRLIDFTVNDFTVYNSAINDYIINNSTVNYNPEYNAAPTASLDTDFFDNSTFNADNTTKIIIIAKDLGRVRSALNPEEYPQIKLIEREAKKEDLKLGNYVILADGDRKFNREMAEYCLENGIPVNTVDDAGYCSFIFPAILKRGALTISISTSGKSPLCAARLKNSINSSLPDNIEEMLDQLGFIRSYLPEKVENRDRRKLIYQNLLDEMFRLKRVLSKDEIGRIIET